MQEQPAVADVDYHDGSTPYFNEMGEVSADLIFFKNYIYHLNKYDVSFS